MWNRNTSVLTIFLLLVSWQPWMIFSLPTKRLRSAQNELMEIEFTGIERKDESEVSSYQSSRVSNWWWPGSSTRMREKGESLIRYTRSRRWRGNKDRSRMLSSKKETKKSSYSYYSSAKSSYGTKGSKKGSSPYSSRSVFSQSFDSTPTSLTSSDESEEESQDEDGDDVNNDDNDDNGDGGGGGDGGVGENDDHQEATDLFEFLNYYIGPPQSSSAPSRRPSESPSLIPSISIRPSQLPSSSDEPSIGPTGSSEPSTAMPSSTPSRSLVPTELPSFLPSGSPSFIPIVIGNPLTSIKFKNSLFDPADEKNDSEMGKREPHMEEDIYFIGNHG